VTPIDRRARATPVVAIVGAGFAGIGMAMQLARAGIRSFTLFERAARVGGTWRENTYPGAACDVPSHLYSFSFEQNPDWARTYAGQEEILRYLERCVATYGLGHHIRFGTDVLAARFDERGRRWTLDLGDGSTFDADVLVTACGVLNRPQFPNVPGRDSFAGPAFHSARWRHDVDLAGKRVAVIGSGASAVQIVPEIAPQVASLTLFQRSAAYIIPKPDRPYSAFERGLYRRFPFALRVSRAIAYVTHEVRFVAFGYARAAMLPSRRIFEKLLARQVSDPDLRRKLTPEYMMGCKRVMISNEYFPALARENVEVVTDRVERITATGVTTAGGRERPFDALIYATGFAASEFLVPMRVNGRGGVDLYDVWKNGAEAYLGISAHGFPNFFMLYGPNTNLGHNSIVFMLEVQIAHILDAIETLARGERSSLEVRANVQSGFNAWLRKKMRKSVWAAGCTSWYVDASGKNTLNWPDFTFEYRRRAKKLRLRDYANSGSAGP
jgi:cation diffusion facilitator CzcD-associated flavoprotein CzcO